MMPAKLKASSMLPPLQPAFCVEQSTSCCSDIEVKEPVPICHAPSMPPVVEKAQQLPHWPWSFTGVTAPWVVQSTDAASSSPWYSCTPMCGKLLGAFALNSAKSAEATTTAEAITADFMAEGKKKYLKY